MDKTYETVELNISGQVANIKMNRPKALNALNSTLIEELGACFAKVEKDKNIKIVVLSGNGGAFSAGGDIKEMLELQEESMFFEIMEKINKMIISLYTMPKLTIAAIEGPAAGLGLSIALAADYIIGKKGSKLAMNFIGIGLIPDGGSHFLLKKRLGEIKAKQLIWDGKVLDPAEAFQIGIIDEVTDQLEGSIQLKLQSWLNKPLLAMIKTKNLYAELNREKLLNDVGT